jgi:hypothetical protein
MRKSLVAGLLGAVVTAGVLVPVGRAQIRSEQERAEALERRAAVAEQEVREQELQVRRADVIRTQCAERAKELKTEWAKLNVEKELVEREGNLEYAVILAVAQGIRPEQLQKRISVPPSADSGTEVGRGVLEGIGFATDRSTLDALRDSTRYVVWVLVRGDDRPLIGIYWDQMAVPHLFMGWVTPSR